ncbi:hypothetical protein [Actinoallomurus acaciae]|uniref:Uncharacterized protein n=1 Tax=Actinoallomurus acaciae TaxID=502577 RepID=A0ABV5YMC1_9ACTN
MTVPLLIIVLPVRLLWEALKVIGRYVLRPLGWLLHNALVRPVAWILRELLWRPIRWAVRVLVVLPLRWAGRRILLPLGRAILRYVLVPLLSGFAWVVMLVARPVGRALAALWRAVLWPVLAAFGRLLAHAWRLAGVILHHLLVRPLKFVWRMVLKPVLRAVRQVWRATAVPAARWFRHHVREPVRAAGRSVSRALGLDAWRP